MKNHPITPPPELVKQWATANGTVYKDLSVFCQNIANEAARWGADQELKACCEWMRNAPFGLGLNTSSNQLRAVRRLKPPSLKKQALAIVKNLGICDHLNPKDQKIICRALEQLND